MGKRRANGEGYLGIIIEKHKRKKFLKQMCKTCSECQNKCNREQFEVCDKCQNCKQECLKYCDRYYCYKRVHSQITIDGRQTTVASSKSKSEAVNKKMQAEAKAFTGNYIKKNNIRILDLIRKIDDEKFKNR